MTSQRGPRSRVYGITPAQVAAFDAACDLLYPTVGDRPAPMDLLRAVAEALAAEFHPVHLDSDAAAQFASRREVRQFLVAAIAGGYGDHGSYVTVKQRLLNRTEANRGLTEARFDAGVTMPEVAEALGLEINAYRKVEIDGHWLSGSLLEAAEQAVGLPSGALQGLDAEDYPAIGDRVQSLAQTGMTQEEFDARYWSPEPLRELADATGIPPGHLHRLASVLPLEGESCPKCSAPAGFSTRSDRTQGYTIHCTSCRWSGLTRQFREYYREVRERREPSERGEPEGNSDGYGYPPAPVFGPPLPRAEVAALGCFDLAVTALVRGDLRLPVWQTMLARAQAGMLTLAHPEASNDPMGTAADVAELWRTPPFGVAEPEARAWLTDWMIGTHDRYDRQTRTDFARQDAHRAAGLPSTNLHGTAAEWLAVSARTRLFWQRVGDLPPLNRLLLAARSSRGVSVARLAAAVGMNPAWLYQAEHGDVGGFLPETLAGLAAALDMPLWALHDAPGRLDPTRVWIRHDACTCGGTSFLWGDLDPGTPLAEPCAARGLWCRHCGLPSLAIGDALVTVPVMAAPSHLPSTNLMGEEIADRWPHAPRVRQRVP